MAVRALLAAGRRVTQRVFDPAASWQFSFRRNASYASTSEGCDATGGCALTSPRHVDRRKCRAPSGLGFCAVPGSLPSTGVPQPRGSRRSRVPRGARRPRPLVGTACDEEKHNLARHCLPIEFPRLVSCSSNSGSRAGGSCGDKLECSPSASHSWWKSNSRLPAGSGAWYARCVRHP